MPLERRISIVGPGRVGKTLGRALREAGYEIEDVIGRQMDRTAGAVEFIGGGRAGVGVSSLSDRWNLLLLAVPDDALPRVSQELASHGPSSLAGRVAIHTSGFHPASILEPLRRLGASVASLHPLMTFPDPQRSMHHLSGITYVLEGDPKACAVGRELVESLSGHARYLGPGGKPLYHAAAVMMCGHLVALVEASFRLLQRAGWSPEESREAFAPLLRQTLENVVEAGPAGALTGPFARGDAGVVRSHLEALEESGLGPILLPLYALLGRLSLEFSPISLERKQQLEEILRSNPKIRG